MEIITLDADYAGIFAASNLCKHPSLKVTFIDKNPYHQLLQQIHTLAAGTKEFEDVFAIGDIFAFTLTNGKTPFRTTSSNMTSSSPSS
jgi:hypothetical protein